MNRTDFEQLRTRTVEILNENSQSSTLYDGQEALEQGVLDMLKVTAKGSGFTELAPTLH